MSTPRQSARQWWLRAVAQEAPPKKIANSNLRMLSAHNQSFVCTDVRVGDSSLFYKTVSRRSAPRWRGPSATLDIDEAGGAVKSQGRTFKVAGYCVCREMDPKDVGEMGWKPASESSEEMDVLPSSVLGKRGGGEVTQIDGREGASGLSTGSPGIVLGGRSDSRTLPPSLSVPLPPYPTLSFQVPPSPSPLAQAPRVGSSSDKNRAPLPETDGGSRR